MSERKAKKVSSSTLSEGELKVNCGKCSKEVEPDISKVFPGRHGITILCPECNKWTVLRKEDAVKLEEYLKRIGKWDEIVRRKEEEMDDMTFVLNLIDTELGDYKVKEDDRKSIRDFFEIQSVNVMNWFDPYVIHWVTANLDQLLRTLGYKTSTVTVICGKVRTRLQLELMKRQREMQLTGMFQNYPVVQQAVTQPNMMQQPMLQPQATQQPQLPFITPTGMVMQPNIPQPNVMQTGTQQTVEQPISQQPSQPQPQQTATEVVVEEELDEKGEVKKRIVRKPGQESELERLISLGLLKPPAESTKETVKDVVSELVKGLKDAGVFGREETKSSVSSLIDTYGDRRTKELEEKLEEQRKEMEKLREELRKKEIEDLHYKMEHIEEKYREELERVKKEVEQKSYAGKPETVQTMEVRKDMLGKVSDDFKEILRTSMETTIAPFVDLMRVQNLQTLLAWEEAGRIPKGTVNRMLAVKKASKEDVEKAKEKLSKLRGGK